MALLRVDNLRRDVVRGDRSRLHLPRGPYQDRAAPPATALLFVGATWIVEATWTSDGGRRCHGKVRESWCRVSDVRITLRHAFLRTSETK
jgi:hypothetical protein